MVPLDNLRKIFWTVPVTKSILVAIVAVKHTLYVTRIVGPYFILLSSQYPEQWLECGGF